MLGPDIECIGRLEGRVLRQRGLVPSKEEATANPVKSQPLGSYQNPFDVDEEEEEERAAGMNTGCDIRSAVGIKSL